jgi:hypothetical protein
MLGSYGWGRLYDYAGSKLYPLLGSHLVITIINFSLLLFTILLPIQYPGSVYPCLAIVGFLLGSTDFLANAIINNSITKNYDVHDIPTAFAWYRFCYCIAFALMSALSYLIPGADEIENGSSSYERYGWSISVAINVLITGLSLTSATMLERIAVRKGRRPSAVGIVMLH